LLTPAELEEIGKLNKAEAEKFLKENAKRKDVITTKSGLQYKILKEGTGPQPKETDVVVISYRGTLIDGTEFDNSLTKRMNTITFPLDHTLKGWTEGIQLMKVGSKYQFFIPPELAYGKNIVANYISPYSLLIYEIELIKIQ
jgi:FKBP-type peptidyl-prolyl cis-trans isomerase